MDPLTPPISSPNIIFETPETEEGVIADPETMRTDEAINVNSYTSSPPATKGSENVSNVTNNNSEVTEDCPSKEVIKIPIVGFETTEERAKFTVFKLKIDNTPFGDSWLVCRRYTDFVRLHSKIKENYPELEDLPLPPKRWLRDNFDVSFLEERMEGLQILVNRIFSVQKLVATPFVREFFCLDEPPSISNGTIDETRSVSGTNSDENHGQKATITQLKRKDREIERLREELAKVSTRCPHCPHCNTTQLMPRMPKPTACSTPVRPSPLSIRRGLTKGSGGESTPEEITKISSSYDSFSPKSFQEEGEEGKGTETPPSSDPLDEFNDGMVVNSSNSNDPFPVGLEEKS